MIIVSSGKPDSRSSPTSHHQNIPVIPMIRDTVRILYMSGVCLHVDRPAVHGVLPRRPCPFTAVCLRKISSLHAGQTPLFLRLHIFSFNSKSNIRSVASESFFSGVLIPESSEGLVKTVRNDPSADGQIFFVDEIITSVPFVLQIQDLKNLS